MIPYIKFIIILLCGSVGLLLLICDIITDSELVWILGTITRVAVSIALLYVSHKLTIKWYKSIPFLKNFIKL